MEKNLEWKLLGASDIEIRPQFFGNGEKDKLTLLLYQNARTAMNAFDEKFGEFNWKCDYKEVAGKVYGCIAVWDADKNAWVEKWETGEESNIAADKGQASDIFKRAAVRWGYARELYTAPRIIVENDGYNCSGYRVSQITYDENRRINSLEIVDRFGNVKYTYGNGQEQVFNKKQPSKPVQNTKPVQNKGNNLEMLREFCRKQIEAEPEWKDDILKFGTTYSKLLPNWKGNFLVEKCYEKWVANRRANIAA